MNGPAMPLRAAVALAIAVLAVHLWVLRAKPPRVQAGPPALRTTAFAFRTIAPPAPLATAPTLASPAPPPRPASTGERPPVRGAVQQARRRAAAGPAAGGEAAPEAAPAAAAPSARPDAAAARVSIPAPLQLHYQVTASVKERTSQGRSELHWHHDGATYEARFEVAAPPLRPRVQHSAGRLAGAGLEPLRFGERGRGEQATHFDREQQRLVFSANRPSMPLPPGAQDRLSVLLQLAALLAGDPARYAAGATVIVDTATAREAGAWRFSVEGEEALALPGGTVAALKLTRAPRGEYDQRLEVWLAPGLAYVPVRLRLTQPNGDWVDHQWSATDRR